MIACGVMSAIVALDWWLSHRKTFRKVEFQGHSLNVVKVKLAFAIVAFLIGVSVSIFFISVEQYRADIV